MQEPAARQPDGAMPVGHVPATLGPFRLRRIVAQHEGGTVYEAVDPRVEQRLAVRAFPAHLLGATGADEQARLREAALAAADLQHPHLIAVHEFEWEGPTAYVATDFFEGETLARYLARVGRLPAFQGLALAAQLLAALAHAHERGLVHGAIHPEHLLIGRDGRLKVDGFGWLSAVASARPGAFEDARYRSPEQIAGETADARSDLYSAAVVAYQLLTGALPPGSAQAPDAAAVAQPTGAAPTQPAAPVSVRSVRPELPARLDVVFSRALAATPHLRYARATALAAALHDALGEPVWTRPEPPFRPSRLQDCTGDVEQPQSVAHARAARPARHPRGRRRRAGLAAACVLGVVVLGWSLLDGVRFGAGTASEAATKMAARPAAGATPPATLQPTPAATVAPSPRAPATALAAAPAPERPAPALAPWASPPATTVLGAGPPAVIIDEPREPPEPVRTTPERVAPRAPAHEPPMARAPAPDPVPPPAPRMRGRDDREERVARHEPRPVRRGAPASTRYTVVKAQPLFGCRQDMDLAREMCVVLRCATAEFRRHPVCVRLHAEARVRHTFAENHNGP